jgi:Holliday junction resolvasome RuvABC endonuclease subunit
MKILGIDPSLSATGLAMAQDGKWVRMKVLANKLRGHERMQYILDGIATYVESLNEGDMIVMEGPSYNSRGRATHELAGIWWMVRHMLWRYSHIKVIIVPPSVRAKYATGKGNAGKPEVLASVIRDHPDAEILDHNMADAMIFAAMGSRSIGKPMEIRMQESPEMEAYDKVNWDDGV